MTLGHFDLQCESEINVITLPELKTNASPEDFIMNFNKYWSYVSELRPDAVLMPYINLNQEPEFFKKKLNLLSEYEGVLYGIGIKFASIRTYRPNLMHLASFSDKDFWIHCSSGRRATWNSPIPTCQLHVLQRFGIDIVSIEIPMNVGGRAKPSLDTRYFNQEKLTIPVIRESLKDGDLTCNCPICQQQNFSELTEDLSRFVGPNKSINSVLNDFSKIHEVYASTYEFEISRERIKEGDLINYFREKEGLMGTLY